MDLGLTDWLYVIPWSVCYATGCLLASRQLIHWFQLESYQFPGYFRTLKRQGWKTWFLPVIMTVVTFIICILIRLCTSFLSVSLSVVSLCLLVLAEGYVFYFHGKKQKAKKNLVFTPRIKRLYGVCMILWSVLAFLWCLLWRGLPISGSIKYTAFNCLFACGMPVWVGLGGLLAWPVEKVISELYFRDAQKILRERKDLIRIGITGSWGKTSVKFILGTILNEKYPTLVTPSSFNTPMGVTKVIRTQLEPGYRIFIAEMGARHVGDIKEMCRLVNPAIGILTSVGPQHLDTFHTQERITKTKYELIEAIPENGSCFFSDDDGIVKELWEKTGKEKYLAGLNPENDDVWAECLTVSPEGSSFILCTGKERIPCKTELLGELNIRNIVLAASVCLKLGMSGNEISRGVRKLKPVEHRLELKRNPGGITVLDDAFNSNIQGALQACNILRQFPGKRIIVTPGMVELGDQEAMLNRELGQKIADCCDEVILVGKKRTESIIEGLYYRSYDKNRIHVAASLDDAANILRSLASRGDTILFENDLPDNYNEE